MSATITQNDNKLLYTIAKSTAVQSVGGVIVLQMKQNNYSMSEIRVSWNQTILKY